MHRHLKPARFVGPGTRIDVGMRESGREGGARDSVAAIAVARHTFYNP